MSFLLSQLLAPIVSWDYRQRRLGKRPDRWHWADLWLWRLGYWTIGDCIARRVPSNQSPQKHHSVSKVPHER